MGMGYLSKEDIELYLPSENPKKVDRQFCWDIFKTVHPVTSKAYYDRIVDEKMGSRIPKTKTNELNLDDECLDLLLKFDHLPVSISNRHPSSINHITATERKEVIAYHRLHQVA